MNQEISPLSKLTSKPRAFVEKTAPQAPKEVEPSLESKALNEFQIKMEQIDHAFALVEEISRTLKTALKDLAPD